MILEGLRGMSLIITIKHLKSLYYEIISFSMISFLFISFSMIFFLFISFDMISFLFISLTMISNMTSFLFISQVADMYENPGPLQFQGPSDLVDSVTSTLTLDTFSYLQDIKKLQSALASIQDACRYSISFINLSFHHFF